MVESFIRYLHVFNLVSTFLLIHLQAVYVSALCFVAYKTSRWVPKKLPFYGKELNNLSAIKLDIFFGVLPPGVTFHSSYPSFEKFTRRLYKPLSKVVYCAAKSVFPTILSKRQFWGLIWRKIWVILNTIDFNDFFYL